MKGKTKPKKAGMKSHMDAYYLTTQFRNTWEDGKTYIKRKERDVLVVKRLNEG